MADQALDVTRYVDLTLLDTDAQALIGQALADARSKLPGWRPREGHTEVVLLEAQALVVAELVYAVNRLPGALMEAVLRAYGLTREPGAPPTTVLRFTTASAAPVTVPAGTRVRVIYADGAASQDFTTDVDLLLGAGTPAATVAATGDVNTSAVNALPPGSRVELVDNVSAVETVAVAATITGGVDLEDGPEFLDRGVNTFARLTSTLGLPSAFTAAALATSGVARATTLDLFDPAATTGGPGDHLGHVTVAVVGPAGVALPELERAALEAALGAQAMASLAVHVIPVTVTALDVTVTVAARPGAVEADVVAAVRAALREVLDPDVAPFGGTVYRNRLLAAADRAEGVARVVDVTAPAGDVVLPGRAALVKAGVLTVNVVPA